jgi:transcriptional regulator of acetoin/glycerol metabolism
MRRLVSHPWPGNVRELENVIRRLLILGLDTIDQEDLPAEILSARASLPRASSLRRLEEAAIRRALEASRGSRTEAARALGIDRKTLYLKLKRLEFDH